MDYIEIIDVLEKQYLSHLTVERAEHSRRTAVTALELAVKYGVDREKAYLSGLAHDIAKELSDQEILEWAVKYKPRQILKEERELPLLLHGRAAAAILVQELDFHDEEILDSITWHISGDQYMTPLDKVVYCADYLEPGRTFLKDEFRKMALSDNLDFCVRQVLISILEYRKKKGGNPSKRELDILNSWAEAEEEHNA